jgi:pyrroline-5-carboxylate reductase
MSAGLPRSLLLFGAGKMGAAMLEGWLKAGLSPAAVTVIDPHPSARMQSLAGEGLTLNPQESALKPAEVAVLAIKPQMLDAAAPVLAKAVDGGTLLLSVLAGKRIADIAARVPALTAIVRAMPNTPAAVGRGITGCFASAATSAAQRDQAVTLLRAVGEVVFVAEERLIDAVTAVSGSGPAYVFHLVECMAKAGEALGLPPETAMALARRTVEGAGELLFQDQGSSAETLRRNVTSPAGTTAAALAILMAEDGLQPLMTAAIAAARRRGEELSG